MPVWAYRDMYSHLHNDCLFFFSLNKKKSRSNFGPEMHRFSLWSQRLLQIQFFLTIKKMTIIMQMNTWLCVCLWYIHVCYIYVRFLYMWICQRHDKMSCIKVCMYICMCVCIMYICVLHEYMHVCIIQVIMWVCLYVHMCFALYVLRLRMFDVCVCACSLNTYCVDKYIVYITMYVCLDYVYVCVCVCMNA